MMISIVLIARVDGAAVESLGRFYAWRSRDFCKTSLFGAYLCRLLRFLLTVLSSTLPKKPRALRGLHPNKDVL